MARNILLGACGSVAAIKIPKLVEELLQCEGMQASHITVVATERAMHFFNTAALPLGVRLYSDEHEWQAWNKIGDPVLHVQLRAWADVLLVAPLDANTLAKLAGGLCDNLLTCIVRAWDTAKPLLVAPAMNTHMWEHPHTVRHLAVLASLRYIVVPPIVKTLACGDTGAGAMAEVPTLIAALMASTGDT